MKHDAAWYDAMYNNRAMVPDHAHHFAQWKTASAQVRDQELGFLDIAYGQGPNMGLDVFPPPVAGKSMPVLVFIHGGYWRSLDKSDFSFIAPSFTHQGALVVVVNYALCPQVTIAQICLQMTEALAWVWRNIRQFGGDRDRISVIGHSAGGHLASMMLACQWKQVGADLPVDLVKAAMTVSGVHDLRPLLHVDFLENDLRLTPAEALRVSPACMPAPKHGKLYAVAGGEESAEFLRQNQSIRDAWGEKRVPLCAVAPSLHHFNIVEAMAQSGHSLHRVASELVLGE